MKVWEEEWDERGERIDLCEEEKPYGMVAKRMIATFHCHQDQGDCNEAARAKLAAAAPDMARMLLSATQPGHGDYCCISRPMIEAVLRKAGVIADKETR